MSPRPLMLAITGALTLSQFLRYVSPPMATFRYGADLPTESRFALTSGLTGWEQHPFALWMLIGLGVVYLSDIHEGPTWRRWGHWLLIPAVFLCVSPLAITEPGGKIGFTCLVATFYAVYLHRRALKTQVGSVPGQ